MADAVTVSRIVLSFLLLFCRPFSPAFRALYLLSGISDMADGYIARKTSTVSRRGALLDSAADFVFVTVCLIKLLPRYSFRPIITVMAGIIAFIRLFAVIAGIVRYKKPVLPHTVSDKAAGLTLFCFPPAAALFNPNAAAVIPCIAAFAAAVEEAYAVLSGKTDNTQKKDSVLK